MLNTKIPSPTLLQSIPHLSGSSLTTNTSSRPKVLFVLTSHNKLGNLDKPTGWYLPEFAHPYYKLAPHCDIVVASPNGGEAPLDPSSVEASKDDRESNKFLNEKQELWKKTQKLESFLGRSQEFAALIYVGGHGPMFDLATSPTSHKLINEFHTSNRIISAVCHGPAAFLNVKDPLTSGPLLASTPITAFSNTEEDQVQLSSAMPFMLETELNKVSGGRYEKAAEPWGVHVVVGGKQGNVITGQNPASAGKFGEEIWRVISEKGLGTV